MRVAPELVEAMASAVMPDCAGQVTIPTAQLQSNGRVAFEWHPATGELSFAGAGTTQEITLPADSGPEPLAPATRSCGSR